MKEYIILEIIPSSLYPQNGEVLQLSALKVNNFQLHGRFDKRIVDEKLPFPKLKDLIDYDNESFEYKQTSQEIMEDFKTWAGSLPLYIIDNAYTRQYLKFYKFSNPLVSVLDFVGLVFHDDVLNEMLEKYNLEPSNYIVDLIFEALIQEENKKNNLA